MRAAYLRLMRASHPDHHPGDHHAAEVARGANAAWSVLRDPERRSAYDRARAAHRPDTAIVLSRPSVPVPPAYSPAGVDYRRAFSLACWKIGVTVFLLGLVLLALAP